MLYSFRTRWNAQAYRRLSGGLCKLEFYFLDRVIRFRSGVFDFPEKHGALTGPQGTSRRKSVGTGSNYARVDFIIATAVPSV
jgi:hypothetical protein